MEFYYIVRTQKLFRAEFQFPTGWNSTSIILNTKSLISGFNSQRDGILRDTRKPFLYWSHCFNSQRDGILPNLLWRVDYTSMFQFPTGWNSTNNQRQNPACRNAFQFPTGWNSTCRDMCITNTILKFQFPTGWNSTYLVFNFDSVFDVSIPNGMEFYKYLAFVNTPKPHRFQFPTGWNSTILRGIEYVFINLFQFPTGWNSTARIFPFS